MIKLWLPIKIINSEHALVGKYAKNSGSVAQKSKRFLLMLSLTVFAIHATEKKFYPEVHSNRNEDIIFPFLDLGHR